MAAWFGTRSVFFLDGLTFLIAAVILIALPGQLMVNQSVASRRVGQTWADIRMGTFCLLVDPLMRYALILQLIGAIAGAAILVNTVGHVQGTLQLGKLEYSWVMAAFGMGATLASVGLGNLRQSSNRIADINGGMLLLIPALLPANWVSIWGLLLLWAIAGMGQTLVNVSTQTLIADRVAVELQGRVYGAHFAWSHLWWAFAYPLAGWMGSAIPSGYFFYSSLLGIVLLALTWVILGSPLATSLGGWWHEHEHSHEGTHEHGHGGYGSGTGVHRHLHFHDAAL
jgi:MFS transporter, NRE family, putaive nickel resistance protein